MDVTKYPPSEKGNCEDGLTAGSLYTVVETLFNRHIDELTKQRAINDLVNPEKLWEDENVRKVLEGYVTAMLLGDLELPLDFIRKVVPEEYYSPGSIEEYLVNNGIDYSTTENLTNVKKDKLEALERRGNNLYKEIHKILGLEGDELLKMNAKDGFSHVANAIYGNIELELLQIE